MLSAQRELEEELGVHAAKEELLPVGVHEAFWHDSFRGEPFHNHELSRIYLLDRSVEIGELRLQEEEVESVCWANLDECLQKLREGKWKSCLNLERLEMLKTFLRGK